MSDPRQVSYERPVGDNKSGGRVDIALNGSGRVLALIEAKAPSTDLSRHVGQVLNYAFHEGVDICVLTTGLEWWLYLPREQGPPEQRCFTVLSISKDPLRELADDLETFLSKYALESGEAILQAKRVLQARHESALLSREIPNIWHRMMEKPDEELLELIGKRIYQEVDLRPTREQILDVLNGRQTISAHINKGSTLQESMTPPTSTRGGSHKGGQASRNLRPPEPSPKAIFLLGKRYPISNHTEGLLTVARVLYERDPIAFTKLLELRGRTLAWVSRERAGMTRPYLIGTSGYFVECNLGAVDTWSRARRFMNHLGYAESDLELLYE